MASSHGQITTASHRMINQTIYRTILWKYAIFNIRGSFKQSICWILWLAVCFKTWVIDRDLIEILRCIFSFSTNHIADSTRTPAFWGYPRRLMITHTIESYWIPSQKKTKSKLQIYKISNFLILKRALHATHLLKLLDKMCKYEMDPMSIVEDTERTRFCPQTDKVIPVYPPFNFVEAGGIIKCVLFGGRTMYFC